MNRDEERLTALEMRFAYQEETITQLSSTIFTQQRQLDELAERVKKLTARLKELENSADSGREIPDERPPHY